jgi:Zn-finger nucleic acid-binding protein
MPEARYPCPVCLGLPMEKLHFPESNLTLDTCRRCGGIWFDAGEVAELARIAPHTAYQRVVLKPQSFLMACHQCTHPMDRNADRCLQCGWKNHLECPICERTMAIANIEDIKLDYCKNCKGVWFDNIELSNLWNQRLARLASQQPTVYGDHYPASDFFLDVLIFAPDVAFYGAHAVAETVMHAPDIAAGAIEGIGNLPELAGNIVEGIGSAPELAGNILEGAGNLAGGIFEAIGAIIAGIFDLGN